MSHLDLFGYILVAGVALFLCYLLALLGWLGFGLVKGWIESDDDNRSVR